MFKLNCNDGWQDVLEKLRPLHPLPGVILEWRRITNALTKVVFPLQREKQYHTTLAMDRIYPIAQTHTATGNTQIHTQTLHASVVKEEYYSVQYNFI